MADYPGYDSRKRAVSTTKVSGTGGAGTDPTNEPGQYPPGTDHGIFGGPLPSGTGAPGTAGASGSADPTNEPGQTQDGLTGISESQITETGAPGTQGTTPTSGGGPDSVTFTAAGSYLDGTYCAETVNDSVSGPQDWTQANDDGYASSGPKLPGMQEPQAGSGKYQPGGGRVLRGGRAVRG